MQVISANSNNFSAAREEIAQGMDMRRDSAEWERDMVEPIRELIVDLATLSKGWARGAVELTLVSAMLVGALVCCALSPTVRPWAQEQSGNDWVGTAFSLACVLAAVVISTLPLMLLVAPAAISTKCDDVKEELNTVRVNGLQHKEFKEIDRRIIMLERAMENVNHGQGIIFNSFGCTFTCSEVRLVVHRSWVCCVFQNGHRQEDAAADGYNARSRWLGRVHIHLSVLRLHYGSCDPFRHECLRPEPDADWRDANLDGGQRNLFM